MICSKHYKEFLWSNLVCSRHSKHNRRNVLNIYSVVLMKTVCIHSPLNLKKKVCLIKIHLSNNSSLISCFFTKISGPPDTSNLDDESLLIPIKIIAILSLCYTSDDRKDSYEILVLYRISWPCCESFINRSAKFWGCSWASDPLRRHLPLRDKALSNHGSRTRVNRCEKQLPADHGQQGTG